METKLKETTEKLLQEKLTLAISGLENVKAQTTEDSWANQIVVQYLLEIANCG